jgi:hypothetical protein
MLSVRIDLDHDSDGSLSEGLSNAIPSAERQIEGVHRLDSRGVEA